MFVSTLKGPLWRTLIHPPKKKLDEHSVVPRTQEPSRHVGIKSLNNENKQTLTTTCLKKPNGPNARLLPMSWRTGHLAAKSVGGLPRFLKKALFLPMFWTVVLLSDQLLN